MVSLNFRLVLWIGGEQNLGAMKYALFLFLSVAAFAKSSDYNMTLHVTQTRQIPFTHGANNSSSTDCQLIGSNLNCNTTDTSFNGIPGVRFVMAATASDGNNYMFSCDAAWRWSHCSGLLTGDYHARRDGGQLVIEYFDKNRKSKEAKYQILQIDESH